MKYGDFSSLIQLGVGLHVGTALLQLYGEIGVQPLVRAITRTRSLFTDEKERPPKAIEDELVKLESDFDIFKIRFFNDYKKYLIANSVVAILLVVALIVVSYKSEDPVPVELTIIFVALSVLPAAITLCVLWLDAGHEVKQMKATADDLESRALKSRSSSNLRGSGA